MRVLRKAAEQSAQLSSYFELCRGLGVLNAAKFPAVERVPDDDIRDLEKLMMSHVVKDGNKVPENEAKALVAVEETSLPSKTTMALVALEDTGLASRTVVTKEWVVLDDDDNTGAGARQGHFGCYVNPFVVAELVGAARAKSRGAGVREAGAMKP
ncbi:hypothetical protein BAE44_0018291 [Dichanthelium oligosanthes]|uniref:AP180 N-terminal homology (ANTH) domain-containing protein n=1 Tax=Dichanthelium oligosanthes TaxID=888268 RepID=A0A1E5V6F3_9POAL|nr:hypothetical protein BAE44_0018291 [Dichanthelium oligosanthes]